MLRVLSLPDILHGGLRPVEFHPQKDKVGLHHDAISKDPEDMSICAIRFEMQAT